MATPACRLLRVDRVSVLLVVALVAGGCPSPGPPYDPPVSPAPLTPLNTAFDDYNAAPPPSLRGFVWSTNRGSGGGDFDIWRADVEFRSEGGDPVVLLDGPAPWIATQSPGNEYGPIYLPWWGPSTVEENAGTDLIFASDRAGGSGGLDLYRLDDAEQVSALDALNSPADDAYWTFLGEDHASAYIASNRGGSGTDIYRVTDTSSTEAPLEGPDVEIVLEAALSSPSEDTAPYLFGVWSEDGTENIPHIVFASDRPGGEGGFDLWCSRFVGGQWETPRNLGNRVNSPSDEFRPSVTHLHYQTLVFSSNRPGGAGGFDLYHAKWESPFAAP